MRRPSLRCVIVAVCAWAPSTLGGELPVLVGTLDAEGLADRDAAQAELLADAALTLSTVERFLAESELAPEQRARLESIARERFARAPKAGLGVRFGRASYNEGVPLAGVVDGFPAAEYLRPGDVVRSINGHRVTQQTQMGAIILSHLPGETLRIELDRPVTPEGAPGADRPGGVQGLVAVPEFDRIVLDVPLGNYEDLNTGVTLTQARLEPAYQQRLARMGVESDPRPVIGGGLRPVDWLRVEGYDAETGRAPARAIEAVTAWRHASFGGQAGSDVSPIELRRGDTNSARVRANRALQADGEYDELEEALAGYRALAHRLEEIRTELDEIITEDRGPDVPPQTRRLRSLQDESEQIIQSLDEIRGVFDRVTDASAD